MQNNAIMKATQAKCYVFKLKNQIPNNQPRTQSHRPPKHCLSRTPLLIRTLQFPIPVSYIRLRIFRIGNQLPDEFLLRGQMADKCLLQGSDFQERFFGVSADALVKQSICKTINL